MLDNTPNYRVFVVTSDKYLPAIPSFAYLFNKYWRPSPQVVIIGFSEPNFALPANFTFYSVGKFADYPFNRWSDALMKFLTSVDDETFVLMLEDYWITRMVDTTAVRVLNDYMLQFKYVIKMDLCGDRLYAFGVDLNYGSVAYLDLVKSMPGSPYHMSLMTGIWRRDHLLRHLRSGESPHDLELSGSTRLSHDQTVIVLGTRQWPVRHTLALRAKQHDALLLDELSKADIEELTKYGLLKPWGIS